MGKNVEYNEITGHPSSVFESLNRSIGQYKRNHTSIKVGITGRNPQYRFNEHLKVFDWDRMVVVYETTSHKYANTLENWLVEYHSEDIVNQRTGGGSQLSLEGNHYLYILLK